MNALAMVEKVPLHTDAEGTIRVGGTRVTLDTVVQVFQVGDSADDIAREFPVLKLSDVFLVLGYYLRHRVELDEYLRVREEEGERIRKLCEALPGAAEIRQRLLARQERNAAYKEQK